MDEQDFLTERFEAHRTHLRAVAQRMLGSTGEAEDAVQEAWLRLHRADSRSDLGDVANLGGWLTTVVGRVCLDMLRSRRSRREEPWAADQGFEPAADGRAGGAGPGADLGAGPEEQAVLADSVGAALQLVLDTLGPAERLAFVLHDLFGVPFEEIAPIVDRSPAATRQLASRARRRVRGGQPATGSGSGDAGRRRAVVEAFLAASRGGDLTGLLAVLDPDVVLRADPTAVAVATANLASGAPTLSAEARGADAVVDAFLGRAREARPALLDGLVGAVYAPGGTPRSAFLFTLRDGRVAGIDLVAEPARLAELDVEFLD